jgi:hypothetical protein
LKAGRSLRSLTGRAALCAGAYGARERCAPRLQGGGACAALRQQQQLLVRALGPFVALLLVCSTAMASLSFTQAATRSWTLGDVSSAVSVRAVGVERPTLATGAPTLERRVSRAVGAGSALANAAHSSAPAAHVRALLLDSARAHVPRALRRTYDAHAPPV